MFNIPLILVEWAYLSSRHGWFKACHLGSVNQLGMFSLLTQHLSDFIKPDLLTGSGEATSSEQEKNREWQCRGEPALIA